MHSETLYHAYTLLMIWSTQSDVRSLLRAGVPPTLESGPQRGVSDI